MKKKIINTIYVSLIALTLLFQTGCNSFLDIRPDGELPGPRLLKNDKGFESAIYGAYASMRSSNLYGMRQSHQMTEVLAQYFECFGNEFVNQVTTYNYTNSLVEDAIYNVWFETYKNIANVNNVLISLEKFSDSDFRYYNLYKGEALGLRAFMHFEILRYFTENIQKNANAEGIPYSTKFALSPSDFVSANKAYELIINDLTEAEKLLAADAEYYTYPKVNPDEPFIRDRETHFNLYAVQATLARVYFTKGDYQNAAIYAKKVVDSKKFDLLSKSDIAEGKMRGVLYPKETIFGIYSTDYYTTVSVRFYQEVTFSSYNPRKDMKSIYEKEQKGHDYRWEGYFKTPTTSAGTIRFIKLVDLYQLDNIEYQRPKEYIKGINMIRLPEMYYILAESLITSNPQQAADYFDTVLESRGLIGLQDRTEANEKILTIERITDERYKEFIGEGQTFLNMKRLNLNIKKTDNTIVEASNSIYVWPIPFDELEYNPKKK